MASLAVQPISWGLGEPNRQVQADVTEQWISHLLTHDSVLGVVWRQLSDAVPHDYPHGGLLDRQQAAKPVMQSIKTLRDWYT